MEIVTLFVSCNLWSALSNIDGYLYDKSEGDEHKISERKEKFAVIKNMRPDFLFLILTYSLNSKGKLWGLLEDPLLAL